MTLQYGTIDVWPSRLRNDRIAAPFKRSTFTDTIKLLDRELKMIHAESPLCKLAIDIGDLTRDGRIRADARPKHPGIVLSFRKPIRRPSGDVVKVPLNFPCDRFTHWQDNLRAIAIALEDLRRIDRYGVTQSSEQYAGFKALPPPGPSHDAIGTVEEAVKFMASQMSADYDARLILLSPDNYRSAYRSIAAKCHPDAGGAGGDWAKLQAAKAFLDAHHKL